MSRGSWHSSRAHASSTARRWNEDAACCELPELPELPGVFSKPPADAEVASPASSGSSSSAGKNTAISAFRVCRKFLSAARNAQSARPCAAGTAVWLAHTTTASHRYSETAAPRRRERRNARPAFSSRILSSSSDSVFPRATAGFVRSPGFFASLHSARNTKNASSSNCEKASSSEVSAEFSREPETEASSGKTRRRASPRDASEASETRDVSDEETSRVSSETRGRDSRDSFPFLSFAGVASPSLSNSRSVTSRCFAAADAGVHSTRSSVSSPAAAAATAVRSALTLLMKPCTKVVICAAASSSVGFTAFAAASAARDSPRFPNTDDFC